MHRAWAARMRTEPEMGEVQKPRSKSRPSLGPTDDPFKRESRKFSIQPKSLYNILFKTTVWLKYLFFKVNQGTRINRGAMDVVKK